MSCSKTSNNKYFDCPARMSDARFCTDYRPNSYMNTVLKVSNDLENSYQYRVFLQRNADKIFQLNNNLFFVRNGCGPCVKPYNEGTIPPNQNTMNCNSQSCNLQQINPNGIGLGIDYNTKRTVNFNQPNINSNKCSDMFSNFNQNGI
tara:strand:+ start:29 stop:469 length:441 start_codon:yes stop_codon:yes gene_type:complete